MTLAGGHVDELAPSTVKCRLMPVITDPHGHARQLTGIDAVLVGARIASVAADGIELGRAGSASPRTL